MDRTVRTVPTLPPVAAAPDARPVARPTIAAARRLAAAVASAAGAWRRHRAASRAFARLNELDDRMLADIGISRGLIPYASRIRGGRADWAPALDPEAARRMLRNADASH
jgi:uncharacterized protein YjiS (DUF1127 family)